MSWEEVILPAFVRDIPVARKLLKATRACHLCWVLVKDLWLSIGILQNCSHGRNMSKLIVAVAVAGQSQSLWKCYLPHP